MKFSDTEDVLEMFVEDVEETVCETPEEEEGGDEDEACVAIFFAHGCADDRYCGWWSAACHCV